MTKTNEIKDPKSCLNKAADDEPLFVIRAKDVCAPAAVRGWARIAIAGNHHEPEKIAEALVIATAMEDWWAKQR